MAKKLPTEAEGVAPKLSPSAGIPKDPQPSVDRIDDLARRILVGDILLPKFQRDFVWEKSQVIKLWDSIARGYPIGSILLWQSRQALASENAIADLEITVPKPDYPVNYLLDGQQRLSSICGAMFWMGSDAKSPWNLAYDLREGRFIHLDTLDDPPQHQLRVNKISDSAGFFKHVYSLDNLAAVDKDALKQRAELLFNRFKDYKIASVTLGDMSLQDVAPIFERINSQGTALTIVDLMRAATWSPDFDLIDSIKSIQRELTNKGFEGVERKVILRNLNAATGGELSVGSISDHLRKHDAVQLKAGIDATKEGFKRAVDFLSTEIHVPGAQVLPYSNQLVLLAEIFRRLPIPNAAQFAEIKRWFWRTSYAGYFSGWNTGMMARDLKAIADFAAGKEPQIKVDLANPGPSIWVDRTFRQNNAHSKLLAIVLGHCGPIDLLTGQKIDVASALAWTNAKEFHHFFPRDYLAGAGKTSAQINSLANFVLLTSASNKKISAKAPSQYLKDVEAAAGKNLRSWLDSNLISEDAYKAALADDYGKFQKARAETIHAAVCARAEW